MRMRTRGTLLAAAVGSTLGVFAAPALADTDPDPEPLLLNHGARVSVVAQGHPPSPIFGQFVSSVARLQRIAPIHPPAPIRGPIGPVD